MRENHRSDTNILFSFSVGLVFAAVLGETPIMVDKVERDQSEGAFGGPLRRPTVYPGLLWRAKVRVECGWREIRVDKKERRPVQSSDHRLVSANSFPVIIPNRYEYTFAWYNKPYGFSKAFVAACLVYHIISSAPRPPVSLSAPEGL